MVRGRQRGFTLIEMLIVLVIVALLSAVAYPSYRNSVMKSRRSAAQAVLSDVAQRQQQYLMDARSFTTSLTDLKVAVPADVSTFYTVSITVAAGPPPTFTASAVPVAGQSQVPDGTLAITSNGSKTRTTSSGPVPW